MAAPEKQNSAQRRDHRDSDDHRGLRERVAKTGWRKRIAAAGPLDHAYRIGVGLVGFLILIGGVAAIPLPGPGWLIVIGGLFVLATEFTWAERLLEFTKRHVTSWTDWVRRQSVWVRGLIALATLAFVCGVLVLTLHLTGVPSWIPEWVPLWH